MRKRRAPDINREDDMRLLTMLDLHFNEGMTYSEIGLRFGMTRSAVSGAICRVNREMADDDGFADGTLPRKWWAQT